MASSSRPLLKAAALLIIPVSWAQWQSACENTGCEQDACCPDGYYWVSSADCEFFSFLNGNQIETCNECWSCGSGQYLLSCGSGSSGTCYDCGAGFAKSGTDKARYCEACEAGRSSGRGAASCSECVAGTYQPYLAMSFCFTCSDGFSSTAGQTSCYQCPAGRFAEAGDGTCEQCALGRFAGAAGSRSCTDCSGGFYADSTGKTQCSPCSAGTSSGEGAASCLDCGPGEFAALSASSRCVLCEEGYFAQNFRSTACDPCPEGTYAFSEGASSCLDCLPGRFNALTAQLGCTACPPGEFANVSGLSECNVCGSGSFSLGEASNCSLCPEGQFNPLDRQSSCLRCPAGSYGEERLGATSIDSCSPCPRGTANPNLGSAGNTSCVDCAAGRYSANLSAAVCTECPEGRFSDSTGATDDADCNACPAGTYSNSTGAASLSECNPCAAGTFSEENGVTECSDCEAGRYSAAIGANTSGTCDACVPGRFSAIPAATSAAQCQPCAPGRYSQIFGATACDDCGPGTWSAATAAADNATCQACPVGRFSVSSGGSELGSCTLCLEGTWSDVLGATRCIDCLAGQWSNATGASEDLCKNCSAGRFGTFEGANSDENCTLCPPGRWGVEGLEACFNCTPGRWSAAVEATSADTCLGCDPGRFHNLFGADTSQLCANCPVKTFTNQSGSTACEDCDPGQMSMEGSTECSDCGAGFYSGPNSCEQCQPARYSDHRQENCSQCEAGFIVNDLRTGCLGCPRGRYSSIPGAANCTACAAGKYGILDGQSSESAACEDCPAGRHSPDEGLTSVSGCTDCGPGTFAEAGAAGCNDCSPGRYQELPGASVCSDCEAGRFLEDTAATSAVQCLSCPAGTASTAASSQCSLCSRGRYSSADGSPECGRCPIVAPRVDADGAMGCCPTNSETWPGDGDSDFMLSMPPGKMLTEVHVVGGCEDDIDPEDPTTDDLVIRTSRPLFEGTNSLAFATIRPSGIHSCVRVECGYNNTCTHLMPETGDFMPGLFLEAAASVRVLTLATGGSVTTLQCPNTVRIGFVGFGCGPGTILMFALAHLFVVCATILLAILFELLLRRRVDVYVELALNVSTRDRSAEITALPAISELHQDLRAALGVSSSELPVTRFRAWEIRGAEGSSGPSQLQLECQISAIAGADDSVRKRWTANTNFLFANYTDEYVKELTKKLKSMDWKVSGNWEKSDLTVVSQPPAVVKEVGRLPGADFVDSLEACAYQALACCCACCTRSGVLPDEEANNLRLRVARATLRALMTRRAAVVLACQAVITLGAVIGLPYAAWWLMTCSTGYPTYIHGAWVGGCLGSNFICDMLIFLQVRQYSRDVKDFLLRFRLPLLLRFGFTFISVTDLYQDATFPVIAGTCGFDLWFVSAWLVFLGVGVMQILVQLMLVLSCWRAYKNARTPEERERHHVEGIFLALRAMDNHVLVYACRPAVEERLGGASCWKMKTVEARVAFSRFIFEDAEQCALQGIFLVYFESASLADKIWIGLSTATSLSLSFTLAVQTFAEVRDWLWHRLLAKFPGAQSGWFLRWAWLMVLVALYRAASAFPWIGSCTPAGDHDSSALMRFFLVSGIPPPEHVLEEVVLTSTAAFGMAFLITLTALCLYRRLLGITRAARRRALEDYNFQARGGSDNATGRLRGEAEEDAWLPTLQALHRQAPDVSAAALLESVDRQAYVLSRGTFMAGRRGSEVLVELKRSTNQLYGDVAKVKLRLPESAHRACDVLQSELQAAVERSTLRCTAWALLSDKKFRKQKLLDKAKAVRSTTGAPLRLLPSTALPSLAALPKCPAETVECETAVRMAEKQKKKLVLVYVSHTWSSRGHPDNKSKSKLRGLVEFASWFKERAAHQRMDVELYFWIDYCCLSSDEASTALAALPLFISACTEILAWRTPDFDRRGWPLMERLLAYCFCRGGLTPYAIDASTLGERDEDDTAVDSGGADGTDSNEVRALLSSAKGPDPAAGKRKVAPAPKLQMVRRQRRLLDPRTAAASRAAGLGAATMQRRMEQLVDMALSVSTLEFFADRQPVEFGMTAVVELWLGPNQPLQSKAVKVPADKSQFSIGKLAWMGGGADDSLSGGRWLTADGAAEASKLLPEWSLRVHTPTQGLRALKEAIAKLTGALKSEDVQVELSTAGSVAVTQPERPQGEVCCLFWIPAGDAMDELRQRVEQLDAKAFTQQFAANMLDVGLDVDASHLNVLEPFQASTASDPETGASLVRGSFKFAVRQQERYHDDFIIPVDLPDEIDDAAPSDREIKQLFAEVDDLIHSQALAAALGSQNGPAMGERLERATCALAAALRADLANAMKEGTETALKDALGRLQDVSLPEAMSARRHLCDLQLARCVESKNISELTMVLREAEALGAEEMTQYAAAKRMLGQLRVRRLQEQSLEVLRSGAKDLESMVAVISVALRRDWEDVLNEGRRLAKAMIDGAKDAGDSTKIAQIWRLADKEGLRVIAAHASTAWEEQVQTARRSENWLQLAGLYRAAANEGCDGFRKEVLEALQARLKEFEAEWDKATDKVKKILKDFKVTGAEDDDVKAVFKEVLGRWKERELMGRAEVETVLGSSEKDPEAVLQCIQTTMRWKWPQVQSRAMAMLAKQVEDAQVAGVEEGVAALAKMQQKAQECQVEQVTPPAVGRKKKAQPSVGEQIKKALDGLLQTEVASQDPTRLLTFALSASNSGLAGLAAEARAEMRKILETLKESTDTEGIARFKAMAESAGDGEAVALASEGLAAVEERERRERENEETKLAAAADKYVGDSVPAACIEVSVVAVRRGWKDLEKQADDMFNARLEESSKAAGQSEADEAILGYRDLLLALGRAQELNSPQKQPLRSLLDQLVSTASSERDGIRLLEQYDWSSDNPAFQEQIEKALDALLVAWQERGEEAAPKEPAKMAERAKMAGKEAWASKALRLQSLDSALRAAKDDPSDAMKVIEIYKLLQSGEAADWMQKQVEKMTQRVLDEAKQSGDVPSLTALRDAAPKQVKKEAKDVLALVEKLSKLLDNRNWEGICELASSAQQRGCSGLAKEARNHLRGHVDEISSKGVVVAETELLLLHKAALKAGLDDFASDLVERLGSAMPAEWAMDKGASLAVRKDNIDDAVLIARLQDMVNQTFNCWGGCRRTRDRRNPLATSLKVEEVLHVANAENYLGYARRREEIRAAFEALDPAEKAEDFDIKTQGVSMKGVSFHPDEPVDASINEVWLWHGTGKEGAHGITDTDFDMGRAGSAAGTMFGRGLYFAESCMKSDEYTKADDRNWNPLILCRVTCGRLFHCDWKRPSDRKEELEEMCRTGGYHCILGDRQKVRGTYREYIVFDNDQVYPEYIVWYSRVEPFLDK